MTEFKIPNLIDESTATLANQAQLELTAKTTLATLLEQLANIAYTRDPELGTEAAIAYATGLTEGIHFFLMTPSPGDNLLMGSRPGTYGGV